MNEAAATGAPDCAVTVGYDGDEIVRAGAPTRFTLRVHAQRALPAGTLIAIARRWPSDWGLPQSADPGAVNFLRVAAPTRVPVRWWNTRLHAFHPFDHVTIVELLGRLHADERVELDFGDPSGGSPGFVAQTFIEEASPLVVRISPGAGPEPGADDAIADVGSAALPTSARALSARAFVEAGRFTVRVIGTHAHRLVVTAPSRVGVGQRFDVHVRIEDAWGNPSTLDGPIALSWTDTPLHVPACGWCRVDASIDAPGVHRLEARAPATAGDGVPVGDRPGLDARSNPIEVGAHPPSVLLAWGDPHAQSIIGCGARSIGDYFAHARDFAQTDFSSHQANCFLVSQEEWRETERVTRDMNDDGRFVTLLGVEWSAASALGGDHNLYFPGDAAQLRRCSHEFVVDKSDADLDLRHVDDLHAHYAGTDTLIAVHVGGRTADLRFHHPTLDRLIEVHSTHATSEWFLFDALRRGYRMGVTAGSDGVDGRPGASHPGHLAVRNVRGGLTAVELPALTREALYEALKARRCYATTGERILLTFASGAWRMGDEVVLDAASREPLPPFDVHVEGTAPIETVDFFRDDRCIASRDYISDATRWSNRIRVAWRGATAPGNWQRARMTWDGSLRIEGARIVDAVPWAFDTPDEQLLGVDAHRVSWRSVTAGDADGVILTLDRLDGVTLDFSSEPLSARCALDTLGPAGWHLEASDPWRRLELRRLPADDPSWSVDASFEDPSPPAGRCAYWIRVTQADGAKAWSTPIFVERAQP